MRRVTFPVSVGAVSRGKGDGLDQFLREVSRDLRPILPGRYPRSPADSKTSSTTVGVGALRYGSIAWKELNYFAGNVIKPTSKPLDDSAEYPIQTVASIRKFL
jgi:hypothetical protein